MTTKNTQAEATEATVDVDALVASASEAVEANASAAKEDTEQRSRAKKRDRDVAKLRDAKNGIKDIRGWHRDDDLRAKLEAIEAGIKVIEVEAAEDGQDLAGINAFRDLKDRAWRAAKDSDTHFGVVIGLLRDAVENGNARVLNPDDEADRAINADEANARAIVSVRQKGEMTLYFFEGFEKKSVDSLLRAIKQAKYKATLVSRARGEARKDIDGRSKDAEAALAMRDGEYAVAVEIPSRKGRPTDGHLLVTVADGSLTLDNVVRGRNGNLPGYMIDEETRESLVGGSWGRGNVPRRLHLQMRFAARDAGDGENRGGGSTASKREVREYIAKQETETVEEPTAMADAFSATPDLQALADEMQAVTAESNTADAVTALAKEFKATPKAAKLAIDHQDNPATFLAGITGTGKDGTITVADVKKAGKDRS